MLKPVKIDIKVPASKSLTQRALLCNYLSGNKGNVIDHLDSEDSQYLKRALNSGLQGKIFLANAGTAVRFLLPFAKEKAIITGNKHMQQRPAKDLLDALNDLGIETKSNNGCPPIRIVNINIKKKQVSIDASKSSQYLSSLLMLAPTLKNGLIITTKGVVASKPYVDLTIDVMENYGIKVKRQGYKKFTIKHQKYKETDYIVEADASSASYWITYNYISDSKINIKNINFNSKQGDIKYINALEDLKKGRTEFDFNTMPDVTMSLAIAAIFQNKKITIKNIANLKIKETNRLAALNFNLSKIGVKNKIGDDYITIWGSNGKFKKAVIKSFDDHRMAMSFGLLGLKIDKPRCVNKSYPDFWKDYEKIKDANVIITGMRGAGKTTYGKKVAKQWGMRFIDLDQELEKYLKQKISKLVEKSGWDYFRNIEHTMAKKYSKSKNTVIATGGGTLMFERNYELLKNNFIILLNTDIKEITKRIGKCKNRPALKGDDFIAELEEVWAERKDKYFEVADKVVKN